MFSRIPLQNQQNWPQGMLHDRVLSSVLICALMALCSQTVVARQAVWRSTLDAASNIDLAADVFAAQRMCIPLCDDDTVAIDPGPGVTSQQLIPIAGTGTVIGVVSDLAEAQTLSCTGQGTSTWSNAFVRVSGLGTSRVEIFLRGYSDTYNECLDSVMEHFNGMGRAELLANLGLVIDGIPSGQAQDVYFAWSGFTFVYRDPEHVTDDDAEIEGVIPGTDAFISVNDGGPNPDPLWVPNRPSGWFSLTGLTGLKSAFRPGAGFGQIASASGETIWVNADWAATVDMNEPGRWAVVPAPPCDPCWLPPNKDFAQAVGLFRIVLSLDGPIDGVGFGDFELCNIESPCQSGVTCPDPSTIDPNNNCTFAPPGSTGYGTPGCIPQPGVDPDCCGRVCGMCGFEYCCTQQWDLACVIMAENVCNTPPDPPACPNPANSCFSPTPNGTGGCSDAACCETVCSFASFCCNGQWDSLCAMIASSLCAGGLPVTEPEPCGSIPDIDPGCDDPPNVPGNIVNLLCDNVVCATSWADGGDRDTDWYRVPIPSSPTGVVELDIVISSDMPLVLTIYDADCTNLVPLARAETHGLLSGVVVPLGDRRATACVPSPPPGGGSHEFYIHVTPATICGGPITDGYPCTSGDNEYFLFINCSDDCAQPPWSCGNPVSSPNDCNLPAPAPFEPGCSDPACCEAVCAVDSSCCDIHWGAHCANIAATHWQCQCPSGLGCATCPPGAIQSCGACGSGQCDGCISGNFEPAQCGQTHCGELFADGSGIIDEDWYQLIIPPPSAGPGVDVVLEVEADMDVEIEFHTSGCAGIVINTVTVAACTPTVFVQPVPTPIDLDIVVRPAVISGHPCGSANSYSVRFDVIDQAGNSCPTGTCPVPPPHDECASPFIAGLGLNVTDYCGVTASDPPEVHADCPALGFGGAGSNDADLWYEFTSTCSAGSGRDFMFTLDPDPTLPPLERVLGLYSTGCPPAPLDSCDEAFGGASAVLTRNLVPGETVTLRANAPGGALTPTSGFLQVEYAHPCCWDLTGTCTVGVPTLLTLLAQWGQPCPCGPSGPCGVPHLLDLLANWGDCP